jgi:tetratricopeptide (TPR) repeat protein
MGQFDAGLTATRRAVVLDPLARESYTVLGRALYAAHRYDEAVTAFAEVISLGDGFPYQSATTYAQWGNRPKALEWLETALRLRDPGLVYLKTDPLMDPIRQEPRFKAIERELKFPD